MSDLERTPENKKGPVSLSTLFGLASVAGAVLAILLTGLLVSVLRGVWPPWEASLSADSLTLIEVVRLSLAIVAGIGGVGALVVAYRRQEHLELDEAGTRELKKSLRERYTSAATQLGDSNASVRLAGAYAMASLADDWKAERQQCVDVLCAYLRLPWFLDLVADDIQGTTRLIPVEHRAEAEVRRTILEILEAHLRWDAELTWCKLNFNLRGAELPLLNLRNCVFAGDTFDLQDAVIFGDVELQSVAFECKLANFEHVDYRGNSCHFSSVTFSCDIANFERSIFQHGVVRFHSCTFAATKIVSFNESNFDCTEILFASNFEGQYVTFKECQFRASEEISFNGARFNGWIDFEDSVWQSAHISIGGIYTGYSGLMLVGSLETSHHISFSGATFTSKAMFVMDAKFAGDYTGFDRATFATDVRFVRCEFKSDLTRFLSTAFKQDCLFEDCNFGRAEFSGSTYEGAADFGGSRFQSRKAFQNVKMLPPKALRYAKFEDEPTGEED